MWSAAAVLLLALAAAVAGSGDIFDVTTVFKAGIMCDNDTIDTDEDAVPNYLTVKNEHCLDGIGYVHARTNAIGLPLYDGESTSIVSNYSQLYNITLDPEDGVCSWSIKDWTFTFTSSWSPFEEAKLYQVRDNTVRVRLYENIASASDWRSGHYYLYFTSNKHLVRNQTNVMAIIMYVNSNKRTEITLYTNCQKSSSNYNIRVMDRDGVNFNLHCSRGETISSSSTPSEMRISFSGNYMNIRYAEYSRQLYYDYDININYVSITTDEPRQLRHSVDIGALNAVQDGAELTSPIIQHDDDTLLCLVMVLNAEQPSFGNQLQILSRDLMQQVELLHTVSHIEDGWSVKHVNVPVKKSLFKLVIRKIGSTPVTIYRISTCNPEGRDVLPFKMKRPSEEDFWDDVLPSMPIFRVRTRPLQQVEVTESDDCLNGGVSTTAGCACPPGFNGYLCRSGCGRNRFGMDCKGLCSLGLQECEGLKLCTNFTGCHCAPGYSGQFCRDKCPPGFYGNDCLQRCASCASSSACDIYTGECEACEPGYVPPYCKKVYVYNNEAPSLSSPSYDTIEVYFDTDKTSGVGSPKLYQVQYREEGENWHVYSTKVIPSSDHQTPSSEHVLLGSFQSTITKELIKGLQHGVLYEVRILYMDKSYNKYDGDLVAVNRIVTKCDIPDEYDYGVTTESNVTSITFKWSYVNKTEHWCPVESFEVSWKEDWQWLTRFTQEGFTRTDLLPGTSVEFKMRAKTSRGFAPFSKTIQASTLRTESSAVRNLQEVSAQSTSVELSWQPPQWSNTHKQQYTISYKCVDRVACSPGCDTAPEGQLTQEETTVTLSNLLPFTQYLITVTPVDGLESSVYVGTTETVPTEKPLPSSIQAIRTNTSVTVFWDEETVCSGFLQGYNYQLTKKSEGLKILASGFTKGVEVTFTNLTASTEYQVKVFVVTVAGWNPESYLTINVSTSATVPEAVQNLTVYKRSRGMVGLRWAEPRATYGKVKSFTVSHSLGQGYSSRVVEPTHCVPWPHLYCHTVEGLRANRKYNFTVSARNMDVEEDGEKAFITGFTKENSPAAPENLKLINSSSTSVGLQWGYPSLANGVVRSFVINVEETEQFDQDSCCQVYPLLETSTQEELEAYRVEVSGLHPASTYYVSVTAKTVALGPSLPLVVYTRPPLLPLTLLPSQDMLQELTLPDQPLTWGSSEAASEVNNSDVYSSLIQAHVILAVLNSSDGEVVSGVENSDLDSLIRERISHPFYFIAEYNEEGVVSSSVWGQPPCPLPSRVTLAVGQVTEYNGVFNINLRLSNSSVTFADCM